MYFWNIKALRKDLKHGLSPKQDLNYLIAGSAMGILAIEPYPTYSIYSTILPFVGILLSIGFLILFYRINGGNNGKNFLSRFISISFVTMIRSLVLVFIPLFIATVIILVSIYGKSVPKDANLLVGNLVGIIYLLGNFGLMIRYFMKLQKELKE